jgi:hypothetical protein
VRGIPYDKRSEETAAYAGSLVGANVAVDKASLNRSDYVRVKIAVRDLEKFPTIAEGAIVPFLYDFFYEREVEVVDNVTGDASWVKVDQDDNDHAIKKPKTDGVNPMHLKNKISHLRW